MLIDNRRSVYQVSFVKRDNLFHIRAVHVRLCSGLMKRYGYVCVCVLFSLKE
jgi:hypothetical protein